MKLKKYKPSQVSKEMLSKASEGKLDFEIETGEATYSLIGGMISKVDGGKVFLFNGKGFELNQDINIYGRE